MMGLRGWRRWRSDMDAQWAALDHLEELIDGFDRAADAAMLEPGCPQIPEQREAPKDLMGGAGA